MMGGTDLDVSERHLTGGTGLGRWVGLTDGTGFGGGDSVFWFRHAGWGAVARWLWVGRVGRGRVGCCRWVAELGARLPGPDPCAAIPGLELQLGLGPREAR